MTGASLREALDRHQVLTYFAAVIGAAAAAMLAPGLRTLEPAITPALALMLFATFLQVPLDRLAKAFAQTRFLAALLTANFLLPRGHHQAAVLVSDEINDPVGAVPADLPQALRDDKLREQPHTKNADEKRNNMAFELLAKGRHIEGVGAGEDEAAASHWLVESQLLRDRTALRVAEHCGRVDGEIIEQTR